MRRKWLPLKTRKVKVTSIPSAKKRKSKASHTVSRNLFMNIDIVLSGTRTLPILCALAAPFVGCDAQTNSKSISVAVPSMDHLPLVDHPEYQNWTKFPIGTTVRRRNEIVNDLGIVVVLTTLKLVEVNEKMAVVESQTTVEREGTIDEKPPQPFEYYAKFRLMEGLTMQRYSLPSPTAIKTGVEEIEVSGEKYVADIFEWEGNLESGKVGLKQWRCNDFPSRIVKTETNYRDSTKSKATEWTISILRP